MFNLNPNSFFNRIGKWIIFFTLLSLVAAFITILTVTLAHHFGEDVEFIEGFWWNTALFLSVIISVVISPIITSYVVKKQQELLK